jgi:hypothetical protein
MSVIEQSFLVAVRIDTVKARNFPSGFRTNEETGDNGYNWNSYPNWDINYAGSETDFVEMIWADFKRSFEFDGLQCRIFRISNDE